MTLVVGMPWATHVVVIQNCSSQATRLVKMSIIHLLKTTLFMYVIPWKSITYFGLAD